MAWSVRLLKKLELTHQSLLKISMRKYVLFSILFSLGFHVLRTFGYISMEFVFHQHVNVIACPTCSMRHKNIMGNTERIPDIIHQIYFPVKSATPPEELLNARATWIKRHPDFTHYLWSESDVQTFIRKEYPGLFTMYKSYTYWVWRVNIARYLILYHYGGWYMDLDLICTKSVDQLAEMAFSLKKSVIQHYTFPVGTSNDFFGVTRGHQFMKSVLDFLPNSNRQFIFPYPNTVLRTGTTYMWGRYLNYPYKEEFMIISEEEISTYFINKHASAWHGWDAVAIRFVLSHVYTVVSLSIIMWLGIVMFYYKISLWIRNKRLNQKCSILNDNNNDKSFQI